MEISVIVPMYNSESTIKACVESILQQQGVAEILLCDDGSTDNTAQLCQHLATLYPCIQYLSCPHQGPSAARNIGLQHAKGKLLSFIDSDDTIDKHMYEEMSKQFHKDVDLVMCSYELSFRNIKQPMLFPFPQEQQEYTHEKVMQEIVPAMVSEYSITNTRQKIIIGSVLSLIHI